MSIFLGWQGVKGSYFFLFSGKIPIFSYFLKTIPIFPIFGVFIKKIYSNFEPHFAQHDILL